MAPAFKTGFRFLRQTAVDWMSDNAPRLGASLAYYTVFSISPLMVIVVAIAGFWFGEEAARQQIFAQISDLIGTQSADAIQALLATARKPETGTIATIIAMVTLLIGSTGVFVELQDALNTVWGVKTKASSGWLSFVWNRVLSFAMVLAIGFVLLVSLVLSAALAAVGKYLGTFAPAIHIFWQSVNFLLSFGVVTLLFALIFKILPDVKIAWREVWIGAVITAFLFTLGKFFLGFYLGRTGLASTYGAAGSVVVILVWVYYSAQILFFGAEFTQVYANEFRPKVEPVDYAEPLTVEDAVPAALKRRNQVPPISPPEQSTPGQDVIGPRRPTQSRWRIAVPVAALFAWLWLKERRRASARRDPAEGGVPTRVRENTGASKRWRASCRALVRSSWP